MNGQEESAIVAQSRANDSAARVVAYFGPYLFWAALGVITSGILLLG